MRRGQMMMSKVSKQIEELRKYAKKWSEWNGFNAAMPVLPSTNIRLLHSAADTIEVLDRPTGKWEQVDLLADRICSVCGYGVWDSEAKEYNYCPNCGAYMKGNNNE